MKLVIALVAAVLALAPAATLAADDAEEWSCVLDVAAIATAEIDAVWEQFDDPECMVRYEAPLVLRLDELLRAGQRPADVREWEIDDTRFELDAILLRLALLRGDRAAARPMLAALRANRRYAEAFADDDERDPPAMSAWFDPLAQIDRVLAGSKGAPPFRLEAPESTWTLQFTRCGTGAAVFLMIELQWPGPADAWVALGEPHVALQELIATQWVESMQAGFPPPRLREFADRALGPGRYETEIDAALASIRLESTPGGRAAGMPLFGMWVPLPVGRIAEGRPLERFETPAAIAAYLRPMLLALPTRD